MSSSSSNLKLSIYTSYIQIEEENNRQRIKVIIRLRRDNVHLCAVSKVARAFQLDTATFRKIAAEKKGERKKQIISVMEHVK